MFTWICPKCGAEVPPAYSDCPNCQPPVAAEAPTLVQPITAVPPPPARPAPLQGTQPRTMPRPTAPPPTPTAPPISYAPPPQYQAPPQPQMQQAPVAPPPQQYPHQPPPGQYGYPPPQARGLPGWLVTLGVFAVLVGAGYAFYTLVLNKNGASASTTVASESGADKAGEVAAKAGGRRQKDLSKYLEAAGIRIVEENRRPAIRLMLINHSNAEMAQLAGTITLTAGGQTEFATIPFNLASLGAFEAKDISAPLKTKLRAYEMPDWQFIKAQVTVTSSGTE